MITYDELINESQYSNQFTLHIKDTYSMIQIPNFDYHITIFRDQWDLYKSETNLPYHLFHVTSNNLDIKCSTYFWVDLYTNQIKKIPDKYFKYGQPTYNLGASTRFPCDYKSIKPALKLFQKFLHTKHKN